MIKLIALDLDGTLLNAQRGLDKENKEAVQRAREHGVRVVICTGRPINAVRHLLEELDMLSDDDYVITFNGGLVQRVSNGEVLASKMHTLADVEYIYEECFKVGLPVNFLDLEKAYTTKDPVDNPSLYTDLLKEMSFEPYQGGVLPKEHQFNKVVSCCPEILLDERLQKLPMELTERYTLLKSRPILIEILPKGVDKGDGLKQLCQYLGIEASHVMAMGDEENDLAMLQFAGLGIAMGNAPDRIKAVAKDVTLSNVEHGVAHAIQKYVLKEKK